MRLWPALLLLSIGPSCKSTLGKPNGTPAGDPSSHGDTATTGGDHRGDSIAPPGDRGLAGDPLRAGDPGPAGDPRSAGDSGQPPVPCESLLTETVTTAGVITPPAGGVPSAGVPFTVTATGIAVTRVSDAADASGFSSFYTNGYSRWSPASITGEYVTAFSEGGGAAIYHLADRTVVRTLDVGEPNELQWDSSGAAQGATTIYYRTGAALRKIEILSGSDSLIHDFAVDYPGAGAAINGVEGAPSRDMRYWAFQICDSMDSGGQCSGLRDIIVYDKSTDQIIGRLKDHYATIPTPNYVDISPSGSVIVVGSCKETSGAASAAPFNGPYAWKKDFTGTPVRLNTNGNHSGWAYGFGSEELVVGFDPCGVSNEENTASCDQLMAVDVNDAQGWANRMIVFSNADMGWGPGAHFGRIYDPNVRGWAFISTYDGSAGQWAKDQLFFVELKPAAAGPRVWRVTPSFNSHVDYWSEGFASLDFQALNAYWGANWNGTSSLELYQARLCDGWWQTLNTP